MPDNITLKKPGDLLRKKIPGNPAGEIREKFPVPGMEEHYPSGHQIRRWKLVNIPKIAYFSKKRD